MTDDKKSADGFDDWDQALSDWENKTFLPEVAKDTSTDQPGALAGSAASPPLYKPPVSKPAVPRVSQPPRPKPSIPAAKGPRLERADEDADSATLIAALPREPMRSEGPKAMSRPPSRGGLGQLFAREEKREPSSVEVRLDDSATQVAAAPPSENVEPLGPPVTDPVPTSPSFDLFSDEAFDRLAGEPRPQQETQPAPDEIDSLLTDSMRPPPTSTEDEGDDPPNGRLPLLAVPDTRNYDPDDETLVATGAHIERALRLAAEARPRVSPVDEDSTQKEPRAALEVAQQVSRTWPEERPANAWLSEGAREAFAARATWLEREARALPDKVARARALLVCSEIVATSGDNERAHALAAEARDLYPSLALAHRQARALMPAPPDPEDYVDALDAELKLLPSGPARVHSALVAAGALRAVGDEDAAGKRLEQAARAMTGDLRAPIERAVRGLRQSEAASPALRLPDTPELAPVGAALAQLLRLRGVQRPAASAPDVLSTNELLLRVRNAMDKGDAMAAAPLVAQLGGVPELALGATWLAAMLAATRPTGRGDAIGWLRGLGARGQDAAMRAFTARAMELGGRELLSEAVSAVGPLAPAERMAIARLAGLPLAADHAYAEAVAATPAMLPVAAAAAALVVPEGPDQALARSERTAGSPQSRAYIRLGRLLAASATTRQVEAALDAVGDPRSATARAVALEMAARAGRVDDVSAAIEAWGATRSVSDERASGALAAGLLAERAGHAARANEAYKTARAFDPSSEAALRAIASIEQVDLVAELNSLADELGDGVRGALARIEAVARGEGVLPEPTRGHLLERAHRSAPTLPIASFLAERIARRTGDVEDVLRWVRERRATAVDPIEGALDGVREALLVADADPVLAGERLHEAHRARPADVALRELYERMAHDPEDRATWREQRAGEASGEARTLLFLEAVREYERSGDDEGALRCAEAAAEGDASLGRIARERTELRIGRVSRLAEELLSAAKSAEDSRARREAYERLALLDATARHDPASALLWHRSILEEQPDYAPSLRHVEHHLIGEGRDDELEPIASAIALALRGTGPGECTAHAELAARLRMRGAEGNWEATREMVELAMGEGEPSLWSLRMQQAHSRARGDDDAFLNATMRLVERTNRSSETASLLLRAGDAASRLGRLDQARGLLQRAAMEDPGDVVAWGLLADVRQQAGDARGAAEACEALARGSSVHEHQLLAWYDAGRIWLDEIKDDEHAIIALEAAAAIDVGHEDVFDRLSAIYVSRKMQPELASLLERRIERIADPEERLAMEVRRGRVLLEVGDAEGARVAFEAALSERPDDATALSAFADLCVSQRDWDSAEQALVRLARLLPIADEQRDVYARLGDLYGRHLLNLSRAEVAFKEVLKRGPDDVGTMEKLVDVYKRQNDPARAIELQQELVRRADSPETRRGRLIELAIIHEQVSRDGRRAEQTLETLRRENPDDVSALRALAEFYVRHRQTPAVNILLDRAGADARRALAAGRLEAGSFEVLATVFDLRGKKDASRVARGMLAAVQGQPAEVRGAAERAFDPQLDDVVAPEVLTHAMRSLLAKAGEALDAGAPVDVRGLRAVPIAPDAPLGRFAVTMGQAIGLGMVQVLVSPKLGATCLPLASSPPAILLGEALASDERAGPFVVARALKLVQAKAGALVRTPPGDLAVLLGAWFKCFNPSWQPQGVTAAAVNALGGRMQAALPRRVDPDVGVIALEVAGTVGSHAIALGASALAWGNRVAFLAMGDPNAALDAIAVASGAVGRVPTHPHERSAWIAGNPEASDLVAFGVSDALADARGRLNLDR